MKIICALFLLGCLCHQTSTDEVPHKSLNPHYLIAHTPANWYEAYLLCRSREMHLVSIHTLDDNHNIREIIPREKHGFWTSGTNLGTDRYHYEWTGSGGELSYSSWKANFTSSYDRNCIVYLDTGFWTTDACTVARKFICERDRNCGDGGYPEV